MPYKVTKNGTQFCVAKQDTGESVPGGCHPSRKDAVDHLQALYANEAMTAIAEAFADNSPAVVDDSEPAMADTGDPADKLSPEDISFLQAVQKAHNDLFPLAGAILNTSSNDEVQDVAQMHIAEISMCAPKLAEWLKSGYTSDDNDINNMPSDNMDSYDEYTIMPSESVWEGPVAYEGVATGDNRQFATGSVSWHELPLPFLWQKSSTDGHGGSVVIGRVDEMTSKDGTVFARGVIFATPEGDEYKNLVERGGAGSVSIDGDSASYSVEELEGGKNKVNFSSIRVRALTAVAIGAFADAKISLVGDSTEFCSDEFCGESVQEFKSKKRKVKKAGAGPVAWTYSEQGLIASAPVRPPVQWFADQKLPGPTPLTILDDGQVFGHIAAWGTCHIGLPACTTPPKGGSYNYFNTGALETFEGTEVAVGHLTFNTGHASVRATAMAAANHYDHTGTVGADVVAGEDEFGIWVAGALRPHLSDEDIRAFRAAPISGDWRRIAGRMELVAALGVNTPGFPVPRTKVLVAGGQNVTFISTIQPQDYEAIGRQTYKEDLALKVGRT